MRSPVLLLGILGSLLTLTLQQPNPQVDLGYEIHEGFLNASTHLYKFHNIRYAQPPVGELRFAAPMPPEGRSSQVENGSVPVLCPQAHPAWELIAVQFAAYFAAGNVSEFNFTAVEAEVEAYLATLPPSPPDPGTTEDCLFLDVVVPQSIFDNSNNRYRKRNGWTDHHGGAPVLVWIYGGAFAYGSKDIYDPTGLIQASQANGGPGVVFVAMNYRLGALGFLSGPTLQAAGGVSNAGFYDQRLAIEWVRDNIHLFGGDPSQITIMGQSAGGGSVEHQITAYGGTKPVSFQRAIPQSPGWVPLKSQELQENNTQAFLALANVGTIEEARQLDSETVISVNTQQIGAARYASYIFGPTVDGEFVPDLPGVLLAEGRHARNIQIMTGHQANEAPAYTPPYIQSNEQLRPFIQASFPGISDSVLDYITNVLYPEVYDGTHPYSNGLERTFLLIAEVAFVCNTNYIHKAFDNNTYAYEFQVPPALHGQDVAYTFYNGQGDDLADGLVADIALVQQAYITNFAQTGNPNGPGLLPFPMQGNNASMDAWNVTGVMIERDPTANPRCAWWQQGLFV